MGLNARTVTLTSGDTFVADGVACCVGGRHAVPLVPGDTFSRAGVAYYVAGRANLTTKLRGVQVPAGALLLFRDRLIAAYVNDTGDVVTIPTQESTP